MNYKEFIDKFKKQLYNLSDERKLVFALAICKKLYFDYQRFHEIEKWGDPNLLIDAIRMCETNQNVLPDILTVKTMMERVEGITPDTEVFSDYTGSYALNACTSILHTLNCILNNDPDEIFWVGSVYYDTWNLKVQEDAVLSEEQIDSHPLMIEAKRFLLENSE